MAIKRAVTYELTSTPGFETVKFTESSKEDLVWPRAVKFAADNEAVLQSICEATAFRIEANGEYEANQRQATRTSAIYFRDGGKFYVAFDDSPSREQNIILSRAVEGYKKNKRGREMLVSKKDEHISQMLERAEKYERVIEVVRSTLELATRTDFFGLFGISEFGKSKAAQALLGDIAEPYARMINDTATLRDKISVSKGSIYLLSPKFLEEKLSHNDVAFVRTVGLGGDFYGIDYVDASEKFIGSGRARGVYGACEFSAYQKLVRT